MKDDYWLDCSREDHIEPTYDIDDSLDREYDCDEDEDDLEANEFDGELCERVWLGC